MPASTVRRALNDHNLRYRVPAPATELQAPSLPDVGDDQPNLIWIYELTYSRLTHSRRLRDNNADHRGPGLA